MCKHSSLTLLCGFSTDNMTGMVGTALYVSPEVQGNTKATYNQVNDLMGLEISRIMKLLSVTFIVLVSLCQKVDLFSLGIILFEMSYHPMTTAAERSCVLSQLRGVSPCSAPETFCVLSVI